MHHPGRHQAGRAERTLGHRDRGEALVEITLLSLDVNEERPESYFRDLVREVPSID